MRLHWMVCEDIRSWLLRRRDTVVTGLASIMAVLKALRASVCDKSTTTTSLCIENALYE